MRLHERMIAAANRRLPAAAEEGEGLRRPAKRAYVVRCGRMSFAAVTPPVSIAPMA